MYNPDASKLEDHGEKKYLQKVNLVNFGTRNRMFKSLTLAVQLCLNLLGSGTCDQTCAKITCFLSACDNQVVCWPFEDINIWLCFYGSPRGWCRGLSLGPTKATAWCGFRRCPCSSWDRRWPQAAVGGWKGRAGWKRQGPGLLPVCNGKRVRFSPSRSRSFPSIWSFQFSAEVLVKMEAVMNGSK